MASEGEEEHTARQKSKNVEDVELPTMPQGGSSIASGIQLMVSSNRPKISLHQVSVGLVPTLSPDPPKDTYKY